jgi:phosphatidylinositol-3-phosphatase
MLIVTVRYRRDDSMRLRTSTIALSVCLLGMMILPGGGAAARPAAPSGGHEGIPRFGHVFLIIGENTTYSHLKRSNAPYLLGTVRPASAWLTQYYGATHWSQANYVALTSGQFTKCEQQDYGIACHQNVDNIFHQIDLAGLTWTTWLEGGTARCDTGSGGSCSPQGPCPLTGFYTTGNPAILYDDVEGKHGVWSETDKSRECLTRDIYAGHPMGKFHRALMSGSVPNFNLILPNGCEDGEANCKPVHNRYTQFDDFLAREVPRIESSPAFGSDGVIIVTYDEDQRAGGLAKKHGFGSGGHIVCAILSPLIVPGSYGATRYHYSLLRTLEDGFRLSGYVGYANDVAAITGIWASSS